jgi:hypothetical protein
MAYTAEPKRPQVAPFWSMQTLLEDMITPIDRSTFEMRRFEDKLGYHSVRHAHSVSAWATMVPVVWV